MPGNVEAHPDGRLQGDTQVPLQLPKMFLERLRLGHQNLL